MRALISAVLVCCIVAFFLVAGCTFNLKNADGSLNKSFSTNPGTGTGTSDIGGIGGGTGGGKSGGTSPRPTFPFGSNSKTYRFQLNYHYADTTTYPRYDKLQTCGPCDAIKSEEQSDVKRVDLIMDGYLGGTSVLPGLQPLQRI